MFPFRTKKKKIRLRSAVPGRERWEINNLIRNPKLAEVLQVHLDQVDGVISASANVLTGRVLIVFDPKMTNQRTNQGTMGVFISSALKNVSQENRSPAELKNAKQNSKQKSSGGNKLLEVIKLAQTGPYTNWHPIGLSVLNTVLKTVTFLSLGLILTVALGGNSLPFLARLGLKSSVSRLTALSGFFLVFKFFASLTGHYKNRAWSKYSNDVEEVLSMKTFEHVQGLDMSYLDNQSTEKLMSLIDTDSKKIAQFLNVTLPNNLDKLVVVAVGGAIMLMISPVALLISVVPVPFIIYIGRIQGRKTAQNLIDANRYTEQFNQVLANNLSGFATVRSFAAEERGLRELSDIVDHLHKNRTALDDKISYYSTLSEFSLAMGIVLPLFYGSFNLAKGTLSITQFMLQMYFAPQLLTAATGVDQTFSSYQDALQAAKRCSALLDVQAHIVSGSVPMPLDDVRGSLTFNNISFAYGENRVFQDVDLHIPAKQTIAFVGPTGSGKSTLIKLLLRFYDLDGGEITLDNTNIRDLKLKDMREAIGLVSQDTYLFNGNIYDNVLYGRPDATRTEVINACKVAEAYEFILDLPDGFNSMVGDRGQKLSGGQRQRISIARAILKNPPILIFDEATSSVDNETEASIQKSIDLISRGRTTIIIAHRLSTIRHVDCIHLLKNARFEESGTHEELLEKQGYYSDLWKLQIAEKGQEQEEVEEVFSVAVGE